METKILIPMLNCSGTTTIKQLQPRYAIQRILKGQAKWIRNNTAIQQIEPCPILTVFSKVGATFSVAEAMKKLTALFVNDPFPKQRASGSLGGASHAKFISLTADGKWIRIK